MPPPSRRSLEDALTATQLILDATTGATQASYQADVMLRAATERWFEVLGEAVRRLERYDPNVAEQIPEYRTIIDFRNRLAHGYDTIDHSLVWRYIREELPALRTHLIAMIAELDR